MPAKQLSKHSNPQSSFIKLAQTLAGIVDLGDVWQQIGQAIFDYFDADFVGFLYMGIDEQFNTHHLSMPGGCKESDILTPEILQSASEVLKKGLMDCSYANVEGFCQVALFPITDENRTSAIMLIGHKNIVFFADDLLDVYQGVARLTSETIIRLQDYSKLRRQNEQLQEIISLRPSDATVESRYEKVEKALVQREEQLRGIVENALEIIYTLTPEGMISYVSPRWTELIGHDSSDLLGRSFVSFLHSSDRSLFQSFIANVAIGNSADQRIQFRLQNRNGSWRWYSTTLATVRDSHNGLKQYVGIAEDITDRKLFEEELRKAKEAAEAATRAKNDFLTNISHEIRTPMTAILGFAEVLLENTKQPEDIVAANTIKRNGDYLLRIINDILDLSKIEAGRFATEQSDCSPRELISDVVSMMKVRADSKGLSMLLEYSGLIPHTIRTDPVRMRQILVNLIGNAIKFTEEGYIHLKVALLDEDRDNPRLECKIIDTGIGMSGDHIKNLFEPFTQGDGTTSRKYVGMGLGLSLCKRLAVMLGGDIGFSSEPGKGSTFIFTVSTGSLEGVKMLKITDMCEKQTEPAAGVAPSAAKKLPCRVLLVEDGLDNQRLLGLILRKAGAQVSIANNGKEALDIMVAEQKKHDSNGIQTTPFDVILMDMQMPVMDGYEAAWRLREMGYTLPIIAVTAHAMSHDRDKCLTAGCNAYLTKPINREQLISTIAGYLAKTDEAQVEIQA